MTPDPEVLEKARFQPEFVQPLWEYVETRVSEKRIAAGRDMLARHRRAARSRSRAATASTGTSLSRSGAWNPTYGEVLADPKIVKSVVRSLATLAYGDRRRAKFGRQQLVAALRILAARRHLDGCA